MWRYGDDVVHPMTVVEDGPVWVEPDRAFERKDEDELVLAVEQGRYTQAEADDITSGADEIEEVLRAWGSPFCDGGEDFRPDPLWTVRTRRVPR